MRRTLPLLSCLCLLLLAGTRAKAAIAVRVANDPADFNQVQSDLQQIDKALEEAQCGGWNQGLSVEGKVATITGLPGYEHKWDGAINSGMGKLTGEFLFPETTKGLATTCPSYTSTIGKVVWREGGSHPDEIVQKDVTYPSPYFEDPTCRWRLKDGDQPPIPLPEDETLEYEELQDKPDDRQREETCQGFCGYLNTFQYMDCLDVQGAIDLTADPPEVYGVCAKWGLRYLCSDEAVPESGTGNSCDPGTPPETQFPNSRSCQGEACRCSGPGCVQSSNGNFYYSYYRNYTAAFDREAVPTD